MGEHAEQSVLVKKAVYDVVVANRVVENVPKAVLQVLKGLLKVLGELA